MHSSILEISYIATGISAHLCCDEIKMKSNSSLDFKYISSEIVSTFVSLLGLCKA